MNIKSSCFLFPRMLVFLSLSNFVLTYLPNLSSNIATFASALPYHRLMKVFSVLQKIYLKLKNKAKMP